MTQTALHVALQFGGVLCSKHPSHHRSRHRSRQSSVWSKHPSRQRSAPIAICTPAPTRQTRFAAPGWERRASIDRVQDTSSIPLFCAVVRALCGEQGALVTQTPPSWGESMTRTRHWSPARTTPEKLEERDWGVIPAKIATMPSFLRWDPPGELIGKQEGGVDGKHMS
jgi:hypothetical protein